MHKNSHLLGEILWGGGSGEVYKEALRRKKEKEILVVKAHEVLYNRQWSDRQFALLPGFNSIATGQIYKIEVWSHEHLWYLSRFKKSGLVNAQVCIIPDPTERHFITYFDPKSLAQKINDMGFLVVSNDWHLYGLDPRLLYEDPHAFGEPLSHAVYFNGTPETYRKW